MAGFIVPFMFVYNRALLLEGQWYELLPIVPGWATDLGGLALMLAVYLTSVMRKGAAKKGTPEVGAGPGPGTRT
ncbi:MAG TPA: hypothetical protein DDZ84_05685, partial [Firmicutes bacterium]|nr:hypothetical protein [Bacillota bacterium]